MRQSSEVGKCLQIGHIFSVRFPPYDRRPATLDSMSGCNRTDDFN